MSMGRKLDDLIPAGTAPGTIRAEGDAGGVAEVDVVEVDRLGASIRGIRVTAPERGSVVGQAARLPEALRTLPERIVPVEVDGRLGGAVLRSAPEEMEGPEFYEVRTDGRTASLERLRRGSDGPERVPFTVTRDQLGRIVDRMGAAMPEPRDE